MLISIGIILFYVLVGGSLLAPGAYELLLKINPDLSWPYSRIFDRVAMLVAAITIITYRKRFSLDSVKKLLKTHRRTFQLLVGVTLSLGISILILPCLVKADLLAWNIRDSGYYFSKVPKVILGAALTALIEEIFFRGIVFVNLKRSFSVVTAITFTSALYATVHFIAPIKSWVYPGYSLFVGFDYLAQVFGALTDPRLLAPWLGLFLVGIVLAIAVIKTGSLYLSIGLHAGWILIVKSTLYLTQFGSAAAPDLTPFLERYFLVSQPIAWGSIILVGLLVFFVGSRISKNKS